MTPREVLVQTYRAFNARDVDAVHQVVRDLAGNVKADQVVQHLYEFRDGLITRMEIRKP